MSGPTLQRLRMSWDEFWVLPEYPRAEWVDGEVVVHPSPWLAHAHATSQLLFLLNTRLPDLFVVPDVGLWLPGNRMRRPDVLVLDRWPEDDRWVTHPPVVVAEVVSSVTRSEDTVRKPVEYAAAAVGQYWLVDPDLRTLEVFDGVDGNWAPAGPRLDDDSPVGEVVVGEHGTVPVDLWDLLRDARGDL